MLWQGNLLAKLSSLAVSDSPIGCIIIHPLAPPVNLTENIAVFLRTEPFFGLESVSTSGSSINQEQAWNCLQVWWSPGACLAPDWCITSVDTVHQQLFFQRPYLLSACRVALKLLQTLVPSSHCQLGSGKRALSNQTFNGKLGWGCPMNPNLFSYSSDCSEYWAQCSWKPAHVHLGRRHMLKSMGKASGDSEGN